MNDYSENDLRKSLRFPLKVIKVDSLESASGSANPGQTFFGYARNISEGGFFIETVNPKPVGFKGLVGIHLPGEGLIRVEAEVVWNKTFDGKPGGIVGMGLAFVDLPDGDKSKISRFIAKQGTSL